MTALATAVRARIPLVIFAGEAPLGAAWYNQAIDQAPFVRACGAEYVALHHPPRFLEGVRDAFLAARTESRPVVIGVPFDLQAKPWTGPEAIAPSAAIAPRLGPVRPDPEGVAAVAGALAAARRPVLVGGRGAVAAGAGPAIRALAERCGALLATTLPARGLFDDDPFSLGIAGGFSTELGRGLFAEADLVVGFGTSFASHSADAGRLYPQARVAQVDAAPLSVSQGRVAAQLHLRADARLGADALLAALPAAGDGWRTDALARRIATEPPDPDPTEPAPGLLDPRAVVAALDALLPRDWQMVNSSGHCSWFTAQMRGRAPERFHTIREFGAIGNGLAYAAGVAAAYPNDTVVLFDGDGSFLMHVQELETIRRHGMRVLVCVLDDGAYGSEIHKLRADGLPDTGAVFGRTDFGAIARGFGLEGETLADLADLPAALARFRARAGAAVWGFPVCDRIRSPVMRRAHP
jgi:thiamine pyrophosphate-dependent acetolactate synthase large subunit-like protein